MKVECETVRNRVGLMDLSTFSKYDVKGKDAFAFLSRICANKIPTKDGGVILGHLLNENGFIESEITVTRLAEDHFYVLSAAVAQLHDFDQLNWRVEKGETVTITDITDDYGVLVLAGPKARDVLAQTTDIDLTNASFRWLTGKEATIANVKGVRLVRVNYVGELGWELHCPMKEMPKVYQALMNAGKAHGIGLFGTYAMNSLRMEKAYRGWGSELTNEVTMIEGAMDRFVDFNKDFVGKPGTLKSKQEGARIQLVYCEVDALDNDSYGNEPVYKDGALVGITTGGAYGHAVGKSLAFAYVDPKFAAAGTEFDVLMMGNTRKMRVLADCAWDPKNERLRV